MTTTKTCEILGVSRWTLLKWEESGELIPVKTTGGHWRYKLSNIISSHGVTIECVEEILPKSYEAELVEDIISLMTSMSAKVYGPRSAQNRQKKANLHIVNGDEQPCN